jgi:hypothetical protein
VDVLRAGVLGLVVTRHEYAGYRGNPGCVFWLVADARGVLGSWCEGTGSCRVLGKIHRGVDGVEALSLYAAACRGRGVTR